MSKRLLNFAELADALGVRTSTVQAWARTGKIPAVKPSPKIVRFDLEDVVAALKRRVPAK